MSMLSEFSFEKFRINKNALLNKVKDNFLFKVDKTQSVQELHSVINEKLNIDETQHFKDIEIKKKVNTQKKFMMLVINGAVILIILITAVGTSKVSNNRVKEAYSSKIEMADNKAEAYRDFSLEDYKVGGNLLKKSGYTKAQIADVYMQFGQYDDAIKEDENSTNRVIKQMYKDKKEKKILDLKESNSYINTEKQIVSYNYNYLLAVKQLISDKDQLRRLAFAFIEHNNVIDAQDVNTKLKDKNVAKAINKKNAANKINELKESMAKETDTNKQADIQKQINDLTDKYLKDKK